MVERNNRRASPVATRTFSENADIGDLHWIAVVAHSEAPVRQLLPIVSGTERRWMRPMFSHVGGIFPNDGAITRLVGA